jgi:putative nucleotidyltransferase with HDIG domain
MSSTGQRTRWYLPLVVPVTASIVVLPAALAAAIVPAGDFALIAASVALAVVISLALASAEAALWKRWRGSRDCVFADLMLWGCVRRWWAERRLRDVRGSYEAAAEVGAPVRIELLEGLCRLLAARSAHTHGHCRRVARHAERIARAMRLPETEVARIRTAAVVHDVGKVYTPREILDKPGPLTEEEFAIVRQHCVDGADMLRSVRDPELAAIVRHHHERLDGGGYPDGLAGEQIPLGARIIAVADTFDALTSNRPYRRAYGHKQGLEVLAGMAGTQLDGRAVAAFAEGYTARRSVASLALLTALSARAAAPSGLTSGGLGASGASLGQLAPALGAAGLLALVPAGAHAGAHERRAALHASPTALVRVEHPPSSARTTTASGHGSARAPITGRSLAHRHGGLSARRAPTVPPAGGRAYTRGSVTPRSRGGGATQLTGPSWSTVSSPPTAGSPPTTAGSAPSSTGSQSSPPAPPAGSSTPTQPAPPLPPTPTPAKEAPAPPVSLPTVNLPPVSPPPVNLPTVTVPGVKVPSAGVSAGPGPVSVKP